MVRKYPLAAAYLFLIIIIMSSSVIINRVVRFQSLACQVKHFTRRHDVYGSSWLSCHHRVDRLARFCRFAAAVAVAKRLKLIENLPLAIFASHHLLVTVCRGGGGRRRRHFSLSR